MEWPLGCGRMCSRIEGDSRSVHGLCTVRALFGHSAFWIIHCNTNKILWQVSGFLHTTEAEYSD